MRIEEINSRIIKSDPKSDWTYVTKGAVTVHYFRNDVNLRFEMTYEGEDVQAEDFKADWVEKLASTRKAKGYFYNLYYGSSLIHRFMLVSVGEPSVQMPEYDPLDLSIKPLDYRVAQIMNDDLKILDTYINMADLKLTGVSES
ncbi:MAG: hypothetical protein V3T99_05810 [Nitrososphaerales archaeon]